MSSEKSDVILSIKDVSKSFPGVKALDGVSIDIFNKENSDKNSNDRKNDIPISALNIGQMA